MRYNQPLIETMLLIFSIFRASNAFLNAIVVKPFTFYYTILAHKFASYLLGNHFCFNGIQSNHFFAEIECGCKRNLWRKNKNFHSVEKTTERSNSTRRCIQLHVIAKSIILKILRISKSIWKCRIKRLTLQFHAIIYNNELNHFDKTYYTMSRF